ncbi:MAG TPA: hypothetical protein VGV38_13480, partial [Pyrinomonadaceae bacterium]|nr:hypothetical protein [Pyrinomonadaceae bacterium]
MLFIETRRAAYAPDDVTRLTILERLQESGLVPVVRSARLHAFETALAGPERVRELERAVAAWAREAGDVHYTRGDVFCFEEFALFLLFGEEALMRAGVVYRDDAREPRRQLEALCRGVQEAVESARAPAGGNGTGAIVDESPETARVRAGGVEWGEVETRTPAGFERFASARGGVEGAKESSVGERSRFATLLEDASARRLLRRLVEAQEEGRATETPAGGELSNDANLARLASAGLVKREVVVSCRRQGRALFRLPTWEAFETVAASGAVCSECGAKLADERVAESVTPTEAGVSALKEGAWMAGRMTALLRDELGLPAEHMASRPAEGDGEAHLLANVCGESFLLYLRDGDVAAPQVRRALELEAETEAAHLVLVATGRIQEESRLRLREHARRRARAGSEVEVLLVEGLESAAAELRQAFERVAQRALAAELYELDSSFGFSVGHMLAARFRLAHRPGALRDLAAAAASS